MKKCKQEECESTRIWSKGFCRFHFLKEFPPKPIKKVSEKGKVKKEQKKEYTKKQFEFFLEIWKEREHICFETGAYLGKEPLSTMFHHCLFKSSHPQFALLKENIVLLHPDVHSQVHTDSSKTPKVEEYTKKLKIKLLDNSI